jgi:hypothetical protein
MTTRLLIGVMAWAYREGSSGNGSVSVETRDLKTGERVEEVSRGGGRAVVKCSDGAMFVVPTGFLGERETEVSR